MADADALGKSSYTPCGDCFTLYLKMDRGVIRRASFQARSCGPVVAMGSLGCGLLMGLTTDQALKLSAIDLDKQLGGLPTPKRHAILLFLDSLHQAISAYQSSNSQE